MRWSADYEDTKTCEYSVKDGKRINVSLLSPSSGL
jgi:hypothetical protein